MSILKQIFAWLTGASAKIKAALTSGNKIANEIKAVADSSILDAVVNMTPTNIDNEGLMLLRAGLTVFIKLMGWADKTMADLEIDPDAKASVLTVLSAKAAKLQADYLGAKLTIQQALASTPVNYDPTIVK